MVEYKDWVAAMMKAHGRRGHGAQNHNQRVMQKAASLWNQHKEEIRALSASDARKTARRQ